MALVGSKTRTVHVLDLTNLQGHCNNKGCFKGLDLPPTAKQRDPVLLLFAGSCKAHSIWTFKTRQFKSMRMIADWVLCYIIGVPYIMFTARLGRGN